MKRHCVSKFIHTKHDLAVLKRKETIRFVNLVVVVVVVVVFRIPKSSLNLSCCGTSYVKPRLMKKRCVQRLAVLVFICASSFPNFPTLQESKLGSLMNTALFSSVLCHFALMLITHIYNRSPSLRGFVKHLLCKWSTKIKGMGNGMVAYSEFYVFTPLG